MTISDGDHGLFNMAQPAMHAFIKANELEHLDTADWIEIAREVIKVKVQEATATFPADYDLIMGQIEASIGAEKMNELVLNKIALAISADLNFLSFDPENPWINCFDGEGKVLLADGKSTKLVRDIVVGDELYCETMKVQPDGTNQIVPLTTEGNKLSSRKVVLVTKDFIDSQLGVDVCNVKGVWLTPEHPIWDECTKKWVQPGTVAKVQHLSQAEMPLVYNFEMEEGGDVITINGIKVVTLGQEMNIDEQSDALYGWGWKNNPNRAKYLD
jgi:hypothetical protein